MKRMHALLIVIAVAVAATAGMFAALRTASVGAASTAHVSDIQLARQNRALDRAEAALRLQVRQQPPALPALAGSVSAPTARRPPVVIYRRPPAIVRVSHGVGEHEHESEGGEHGEELDD